MFPSLLATTGGLLLLFSLSSAQIRGDNTATCTINDGFGMYCPTTCGVSDYMLRYFLGAENDLQSLQDDIDSIANLTLGSQNTVVYMKDSVAAAQKSITPDVHFKRSSSMLDDVNRFEKTIVTQEQQILQETIFDCFTGGLKNLPVPLYEFSKPINKDQTDPLATTQRLTNEQQSNYH